MNNQHVLDHLNTFREPFLDELGCTVVGVDLEKRECTMKFNIPQRYCHSGDIVQGGFVAAMLDAVTTHAIFASNTQLNAVSTLELKVSYLEVSRQGAFDAVGRVVKMSRSIAFVTGEIMNPKGQVTATVTATAKIR